MAEPYTYKAITEPGQGYSFDSGKFVEGFVGVVQRSDGVEVWRSALYVGSGASDKRAAQLQANREAPKWRAYYAHNGRCYHDEKLAKRQTVKDYKAARAKAFAPVQSALSAGMTMAAEGQPISACPHDDQPLRLAWEAGWHAAARAGLVKPEGA